MEKKINIAELLKDCPKGMRLNCTMYENVYLDKIDEEEDRLYPIICYIVGNGIKNPIHFTKFGEFSSHINAKCVIFPKGKTTWEGFHRPFMDGDVLYTVTGEGEYSICMVDCIIRDMLYTKASCSYNGYFLHICKEQVSIEELVVMRFATEEEKARLFQAFIDNGYKWNAETKTLEKLIQPKFKVGDKIKRKGDTRLTTIKDIRDNCYIITIPDYFDNAYITDTLLFSNQNEYELVPNKFDITTLKPFDKVLVRDNINEKWNIHFFSYIDDTKMFKTIMGTYIQCIPYEGNEHLLGTADDCADYFKTWE